MTETATSEAPKAASGKIVTSGGKTIFWGTGRRKESVARVRLMAGEGKFLVNGREIENFFTEVQHRQQILAPLTNAGLMGKVDVLVRAHGGGITGQAGAIVQGVGRDITLYDVNLRKTMQDGGFLTRDSRMKERKKYGLRGARRAFQFSKR